MDVFRLWFEGVNLAPRLAVVGAAKSIEPLAVDADQRSVRCCDDLAGGNAFGQVTPRLAIGRRPRVLQKCPTKVIDSDSQWNGFDRRQ